MNWLKSIWRRLNTSQPNALQFSVQPPSERAPRVQPPRPVTTSSESLSNFTPRAQQVLALARREADRFHHHFVGTEHLLLGLVALGQGTAVAVLRKLGIGLDEIREEVEKQVGTGSDQPGILNIPYTPRVKKVLTFAAKEAQALNHTYVGTEHILLGLLREGDGVAARVLMNLDLDLETIRQQILKELDPDYRSTADSAGAVPAMPRPKSASPLHVIGTPRSPGEAVDLARRYDVYCTDWSQGVVVYRNARFKGLRQLFRDPERDALLGFVELEQSDGLTVFVARTSILRFQEPGVTPGPGGDPGKEP